MGYNKINVDWKHMRSNNEIKVEWKYIRSYASEYNLRWELDRRGYLADDMPRFIVVQNTDGRWTAVFFVTPWLNQHGGMSPIQDFLIL